MLEQIKKDAEKSYRKVHGDKKIEVQALDLGSGFASTIVFENAYMAFQNRFGWAIHGKIAKTGDEK